MNAYSSKPMIVRLMLINELNTSNFFPQEFSVSAMCKSDGV